MAAQEAAVPEVQGRRVPLDLAGSPALQGRLGTHNDALIDQVWTEEASVSEAVLRDITPSDHWPMLSIYRLPLPEPGYQAGEGTVGFGEIEVVLESAEQSPDGNAPGDFAVDHTSLYDNDLTIDSIAIAIVGDTKVEGDVTFTLRLVNSW